MANKQNTTKVQKRARYDRDSKKVKMVFEQKNSLTDNNGNVVGETHSITRQEITPEHAKEIFGMMKKEFESLSSQKKKLDAQKDTWDSPIDGFEVSELERTRKLQQALQKYDQLAKNKTAYENISNRLDELKSDLNDLRGVVSQIPKNK